ncbi:RICIN domain-containing protein [Streptomyces lavendulae]|uniref:RICIN domain-containing protein n=1 Tax=Streptomyces lavendulae TaxID=1914 RepID=UPI0036CD9395
MSKRTVLSGLAAALGVSAMLLAGTPGSATAAEVGTMAVGSQIKNFQTKLCLDSDTKGNAYTKSCADDLNNPYQQWGTLWNASGTKFQLRNVQTLRCLEAAGEDGVRTAPCGNHSSQLWSTNEWLRIKNDYNGRALDSNAKGQLYTSPYSESNPYMEWWWRN